MSSDATGGAKILFERSGPVGHIILNRPNKLNALDDECLGLLAQYIDDVEHDEDVRAVVLSGQGRCFCAGADLGLVSGIAGDRNEFDAFLQRWHHTFGLIESCSKPTIAAVHGFALAGGFELAQVCDLLVVGESATVGDQHANYGLFPGGGSTQRLPRLVSRRWANWMLLSGESIDAATALRIGLANLVVADHLVVQAAFEMALTLAERSMAASRAIKQAVATGSSLRLDDALAIERRIAVEHMASVDAQHGLAAFGNRTRPHFGFVRGEVPTAESAMEGTGG